MAPVEFGVLGPVTVSDDGASLNIGGPKQQSVLAMLIAHAREQVSASTLIHAAYGEDAEAGAKRRIQVYVSTLRGVVGDRIVKVGSGWELDVPYDAIDAGRFERLYRSGRDLIDENPGAAGDVLREALALWRGHPYSGIEGHGLLEGEVRRLIELRLAATSARIDADLAAGHHAELVGEIEALIAENPYVESLRAQHMLALYRAGRQREALRSYEEMRNVLVEDLGVDPTKDLQELEQRILEQDDSLDLRPRRTITRKAVLVVDAGDPLELARLPTAERDKVLADTSRALESIVDGSGTPWIHAGLASYTAVDSMVEAARAVRSIHNQLDGSVRMAIDYGDVEVTEGLPTGAPLARCAVLVAAAHPGQVLLSSEAQQAFVAGGEGAGIRFELLGSFELAGINQAVTVYQLLIRDPPVDFPPLVTDRLPHPVPMSDHRSVPGYELREPVGTGSIGTVYRAYQPSVGREVMVEVIPRSVSNEPGFIRRFEADAQRLTLLDHPNINSPVDYWRDTEGAYVVYPLHRGGWLETAASYDPRRIIEQAGAALSYAHSYGVVHGTVRPDRVMLDESGNAYLMGFPLAGVVPEASADYPAYIAPEALAGQPTDPSRDVFGLGVLAIELREGGIEGDVPLRSPIPALSRAVSEDPSGRQTSVAELLSQLYPPTDDDPSSRFTKTRNPYKGLAAFHEADAADFFGRNALVEDMVEALRSSVLLAVVGPSGIGKSSVVGAGLLPALRRGAVAGSDDWVITDMLPGLRPFIELERALERVAIDLPSMVRERFADHDPDALAGIASTLPAGTELLVVIDQFEELFTMTDHEVASEFLNLLVEAARREEARFVITLRADFMDQPLLFSEFGNLLSDCLITVRAPTVGEISKAIVGPAERVDVSVDPALVERMTGDVHDRPGALPLLQHALTELFEMRTTDHLGIEEYEAVGGVEGSLARRAESAYSGLDRYQQQAIRQVFLRLVTVVDDAAPTRRRVRLPELDDLDARDAIAAFIRARLLVTDTDHDTRTPTVEVAHEALLVHWPRLAGWIEAVREDLALSRRLEEAIADWEAKGKDDAYLLTGGRLAQHLDWTGSTSLALAPVVGEFLTLSNERHRRLARRRRRARIVVMAGFAAAAIVASAFGIAAVKNAATAEEQAQLARDRELEAQESRDVAQSEADRAIANEEAARESERLARAASLAAASTAVLGTDPELSVLLASTALEIDPTSGRANDALNTAFQEHRTVFRVDAAPDLPPPIFMVGSLSPDASMLAGTDGDMVRIWAVGDEEPLWTWPGYQNHHFTELYFDTQGERLIVGMASHDDGCVSDRWDVLDARTGDIISDVRFPGLISYEGGPAQTGPYFDLARPLILTVGGAPECSQNPQEAELFAVDLLAGSQEAIGFGSTDQSFGETPTLSADGSRLATAGDGGGAVIDLANDEEILGLGPGHSVLSPDGALVLASDNPLELWDVDGGEKLREFKADFSVAWFSESGSMVYGSTQDGRVLVFDTESGDLLHELRGQRAAENLQMSSDERWLATFSPEGARVFDIGTRIQATAGSAEMPAAHDGVYSFYRVGSSFVVDDHVLAVRGVFPDEGSITREFPLTAGYEEVIVSELESGAVVGSYDGFLVAASTDGSLVAYQETGPPVELANEDLDEDQAPLKYTPFGSMVVADARTGRPIQRLEGFCDWLQGDLFSDEIVESSGCVGYPEAWSEVVLHASFSPDGNLLAMAGGTGRQAVWDIESGKLIWHREAEEGSRLALFTFQSNVGFSPDGRFLAVSLYKNVEILDVADDFELVKELEVNRGGPFEILWTPDGGSLILPDVSLTVIVIETSNWERVLELVGHQGEFLPDAAIDPTGRFVATAGVDSELKIWDLASGAEVQRISVDVGQFGLRNVEWVDEETLLVGSRDVAALMTLDRQTLIDNARQRLTRSFTQEECATYDIDPCPSLEEMRSGA